VNQPAGEPAPGAEARRLDPIDVFICYRRADSGDATARIHERLNDAFGSRHVFRDIEDVEPGAIFPDDIARAAQRARVMVVVIGPAWAPERLASEGDWVRREIERGLDRRLTLIPVLVNRAVLPTRDQLPERLHELLLHNAIEIHPGPSFERDVDVLVDAVARALGVPRWWKRVRHNWLAFSVAAIAIVGALGLAAWKYAGNRDDQRAAEERRVKVEEAFASYLAMINAYNDRDADAYFGHYEDPMKCFYNRAGASVRRYRTKLEQRLQVYERDLSVREVGTDTVVFCDTGKHSDPATKRLQNHRKTIMMRNRGGRWRVIVEVGEGGSGCYQERCDEAPLNEL
jgi:hypothetical protein